MCALLKICKTFSCNPYLYTSCLLCMLLNDDIVSKHFHSVVSNLSRTWFAFPTKMLSGFYFGHIGWRNWNKNKSEILISWGLTYLILSYLFIYLFVYLFIYLFIYLCIHLIFFSRISLKQMFRYSQSEKQWEIIYTYCCKSYSEQVKCISVNRLSIEEAG